MLPLFKSSKLPIFLLLPLALLLLASCSLPNPKQESGEDEPALPTLTNPAATEAAAADSAMADDASTDSASTDSASTDSASTNSIVEYFEDECAFEGYEDEEITCGYLTVPEDRTKEDGLTVELAVVTIHSLSSAPRPDPVIYLDGGPGGSALVGLAEWLESPLRAEREIILFDQRGTGYSWPNLDCPETDAYDAGEAPEGVLHMEAVEACRERLRSQGIDLTAYHSAASAADVADLRNALGIPEWNLFGISYGTRLGLTVLRDHPQGVRAVVLDSVYPPNVDAYTEQPRNMANAILSLVAGCQADPECGEWYPNLEDSLYYAIDTLNNEPLEIDGESITGDDLVSTLGSALYDSTVIPLLPYVIDEASFDNFEPWLELNQEDGAEGLRQAHVKRIVDRVKHKRSATGQDEEDTGSGEEEGLEDAQGLYYSVECREEAPFGSMEQAIALLSGYAEQLAVPLLAELEEFYAACAIWQAGEAGDFESQPVASDIPVLLLNGEYDPVTPPNWAKVAAQTLSRSFYIEVPRGGHSVSSDGDCPMQIIIDFLNEPTNKPDSRCIQTALPFE